MSSDRPRVDVVVVAHDTRDTTVAALRRLLDTDQGCELRLLVRDNGSTDGTAAAVRRQVPEAELETGGNVGFAAGVNRLLARSASSWVLLLNPDAWPEPGAVGRLVATARQHPDAAAVAPRLLRPDGRLEHSTHPFPCARVALFVAAGLHRRLPGTAERLTLEGPWRHDRPRAVDWAVGAALLLRRAALDDVGPLDERYFMYAEDLEWCWRARRRGWRIRFEPAAVVRHVGNAAGRQRYGGRRTAVYLANTHRFYREAHGVLPATAYRAVNAAGCARLTVAALRAGDRDTARRWWRTARLHLAGGRWVWGAAPRRH